ncbi:hypothetical protein POM88_037067 [Heracleum sosnowskyi]|uniref:DUF6598 domain-containing protein n=1 Tax=Heracleum sosnowskyi TaxID=360622 RepID=A0AAD8HRW7_9APIA|nr:hypothetical protein POM88_037067 [Heracleum sosnowskyi]
MVTDAYSSQYLYNIESVDMNRPSIQPGDELILTNPNEDSISVDRSLVIDIDLFCGKILHPAFSSMVFLKKPNFGINVGHKEQIPLSRSVVAVPYESVLYIDFHLIDDDDNDVVEGCVVFDAIPGSEPEKRFKGKKAEIVATVTWMGAA